MSDVFTKSQVRDWFDSLLETIPDEGGTNAQSFAERLLGIVDAPSEMTHRLAQKVARDLSLFCGYRHDDLPSCPHGTPYTEGSSCLVCKFVPGMEATQEFWVFKWWEATDASNQTPSNELLRSCWETAIKDFFFCHRNMEQRDFTSLELLTIALEVFQMMDATGKVSAGKLTYFLNCVQDAYRDFRKWCSAEANDVGVIQGDYDAYIKAMATILDISHEKAQEAVFASCKAAYEHANSGVHVLEGRLGVYEIALDLVVSTVNSTDEDEDE